MKIPNAFQRSLRELFLLVALAAVGVDWYLDRQRVKSLHDAIDLIEEISRRYDVDEYEGSWETTVYHRGRAHFVQIWPNDPNDRKQSSRGDNPEPDKSLPPTV